MRIFAPFMFFVSAVSAQGPATSERSYRFTHLDTPESVQEVSTVTRSLAQIRDAQADTARRLLTLRGRPEQIALADWVLAELDQPLTRNRPVQSREFRMQGDDVARIFYFKHSASDLPLVELTTVIRSIGMIRQAFTYKPLNASLMRGTAAEMELAAWVADQLDLPTNSRPSTGIRELQVPGSADDIVRVFFPAHVSSPQELTELATIVRSIGQIRMMFARTAQPAAIAVRAPRAQVDLAAWMIGELEAEPSSSFREHRVGSSADDMVRIFYRPEAKSLAAFVESSTHARQAAGVRLAFPYSVRKAIAVRGTAADIAAMERALKQP